MCWALIREQLKGTFIFHSCFFYTQGMGAATSEWNHKSLCNTFIKKIFKKKKGEVQKREKNNTFASDTQQQRWYIIVDYLFQVRGVLRKTSRKIWSRFISKLNDTYCTLIFFWCIQLTGATKVQYKAFEYFPIYFVQGGGTHLLS